MMRIEYVDQSGLEVIQWSMEVGLTIGMLSTVQSSRDIARCRARKWHTMDGFRLCCRNMMVQHGVSVLWYGIVLDGMVLHGTLWVGQHSGLVWYGTAWYGIGGSMQI